MKIGYLMQAGVPDIRKLPGSGPANHVKHTIKAFNELGHEVRLLAVLDGKIWKSDDLFQFDPVPVPWMDQGVFRLFERGVRRLQSELRLPYLALFESIRFALACSRALPGYDLFFERMGWMGYGGVLAGRWSATPHVLEVNGDHLDEMELLGVSPQGLQRLISTAIMKSAVRNSSYIVATGEGWRQKTIQRWGVPQNKTVVVENGSEVVELLQREQLRAFQPSTDHSSSINIIYIGGFEPWHGLDILLHAAAKAVAEGVDARLFLVGAGSELSKIKQLIKELELEGCVHLPGHLPPQEFIGLMAGADAGVSPYCGRVEYSGLKLLDYKAAGLATIASGKDGQPAVIEHGRTGWIVPPCDADALCQAIVHLANNAELRREIGRQARVEAENLHSWNRTAEQLLELFSDLIPRRQTAL